MISTETTTSIVVLQLTDELLTQLRPYIEGLDITTTPHSEWGYQEVEQPRLRLTMRGEVYDALVERVGSALDYDVRWRPNEYEPDGFVERVCPLELTNGILLPVDCPQCGARILANRSEVVCACGQEVSLL